MGYDQEVVFRGERFLHIDKQKPATIVDRGAKSVRTSRAYAHGLSDRVG